MIFEAAYEIIIDDIFLEVQELLPHAQLFLKLEGLNPAGSVKLKAANAMIEEAERQGILTHGKRLIESSSGNLGVALAMVCAAKGYPFTCITDPNALTQNVDAISALGGKVRIVQEKDENNGYLGARIALLNKLIAEDPDLVWLNQYANPANPMAHYTGTARVILKEIRDVDYLFVGAGSTGTLMGCVHYFREHSPATRLIAVDAEGSVTFGKESAPRHIPGIGASRRPEICSDDDLDEIIHVPETESVRMCRWLASKGILVGGSTGSALAAVGMMGTSISANSRVVAISPDLGDRYLGTLYNDDWVSTRYGINPRYGMTADSVGAE